MKEFCYRFFEKYFNQLICHSCEEFLKNNFLESVCHSCAGRNPLGILNVVLHRIYSCWNYRNRFELGCVIVDSCLRRNDNMGRNDNKFLIATVRLSP